MGQILSREEIDQLIANAISPMKELLILGFGAGISIPDALTLDKDDIKKDAIWVNGREVMVPEHVLRPLHTLAMHCKLRLFEKFSESYLSVHIPAFAQYTIKRPIDWKTVRRTYIYLASDANIPERQIIRNTGTSYEVIAPYLANGINRNRKAILQLNLFKS